MAQVATDIMVSKYFRKAGVPQLDADGNELKDENGERVLGPDFFRQVFDRLAEHGDTGEKKLDILLLLMMHRHSI